MVYNFLWNIIIIAVYVAVTRRGIWYLLSSFFHSVLHWNVAVSTICRHSSRVVAFLHAVTMPKFRGPKSASIARSQVWLDLPNGRFQSGGTCRIAAARSGWSSSWGELRAISLWPKRRRRLLVNRWERGKQPVVPLTSAIYTSLAIYIYLCLQRAVVWTGGEHQ